MNLKSVVVLTCLSMIGSTYAGERAKSVIDQVAGETTNYINQSAEDNTHNYLSNYFPTVESYMSNYNSNVTIIMI